MFGTDTSRTRIQDRVVMSKARDTINVFMGVVKVEVTGMAQALVPKEAVGADVKGMHRGRSRGSAGRGKEKRECEALTLVIHMARDGDIEGGVRAMGATEETSAGIIVFDQRTAVKGRRLGHRMIDAFVTKEGGR